MSYIDGELLLETQVTQAAGFSASNVTRASWKLLNSGLNDHYAILKRGESLRVWEGKSHTGNYRTIIEVWQRVKDDQDSYDALNEYVDNIYAQLDPYFQLADTAGTIRDANLSGASMVTEQWRNNADGPSWLKIDLYLDWTEESYVTFAE
jgi:hypothetical protein